VRRFVFDLAAESVQRILAAFVFRFELLLRPVIVGRADHFPGFPDIPNRPVNAVLQVLDIVGPVVGISFHVYQLLIYTILQLKHEE
jgi:hypothetical protein